jgi:hypothetical protein
VPSAALDIDQIVADHEAGIDRGEEEWEKSKRELEAELAKIAQLAQAGDGEKQVFIDRSDCGNEKRARMVQTWNGDFAADIALRAEILSQAVAKQPVRVSAPKKWYGHFECECKRKWTSAHCWEDETQACRDCEQDMLPWKKEELVGGKGPGIKEDHDSSR